MDVKPQKKHSQECQSKMIFNKQERIALFSGKCFMMHVYLMTVGNIPEDVIMAMFDQSVQAIGIQ